MTKHTLKVANVGGFWGDRIFAARDFLAANPDVHYLTLDFLSEVAMTLLARQKQKDREMGFVSDFLQVVTSLLPYWANGGQAKLITNGGGLNPMGLGNLVQRLLKEDGMIKKIAVAEGDHVLPIVSKEHPDLLSANAYLGASPIVQALEGGADLVITGRVCDASLTVGAAIHHYGWKETNWDAIAGATVAGHLIECGVQVTGGNLSNWLSLPNTQGIGYPIAEIAEDGTCTITKGDKSGGCVSEESVKEQLLYEVNNPFAFLTPDVTLSLEHVRVEKKQEDRVSVFGATGSPPPTTLKVGATKQIGYMATGTLTLFGKHIREKAYHTGQMLIDQVVQSGHPLQETHIECIGGGDVVPGVLPHSDPMEAVLRVAVADTSYESVKRFTQEVSPMVTAGPQGTTGYFQKRPSVRPRYLFLPLLIEKTKVQTKVTNLS